MYVGTAVLVVPQLRFLFSERVQSLINNRNFDLLGRLIKKHFNLRQLLRWVRGAHCYTEALVDFWCLFMFKFYFRRLLGG